MAAIRTAEVTWTGTLFEGSGTVTRVDSGAFAQLPVTWASRTESSDGRTSPEELIAAAHASCFSMALSNQLANAGSPAESLWVTAKVTFDKAGSGWGITRIDLDVTGRVPSLDAEGFANLADTAKSGCPVSRAFNGNVEITVQSRLAS